MSIDLGVVVLEGEAPADPWIARLRDQSEPARTVVDEGRATCGALTEASHLLILTPNLVIHPDLLRWTRRVLEELSSFGSLAVASSDARLAEACNGTPALYQKLLCTAWPTRSEDPVSFVAVPRELWLAHRGQGLVPLARRLARDPRGYLDRSGFLAVRLTSGEDGSEAPAVPLEVPPGVPPAAVADVPHRISVVMPVRDRPVEHLRASLAAWLGQTFPPAEVLLVDQRSEPVLSRAYRELAEAVPGVRLLRCERPERWNKPMALNRGIRATDPRSSHVLAADCDLLFHPEALATLSSLLGDGRRFLHGHRCDLPDILGKLHWFDGGVWDEWASAAKIVDTIADPWHLMPRRWAFEVRGYDQRMSGRGYMDVDLSVRAGRSIESLRLGPGTLVALHYPHRRPDWFRETLSTPETCRSREVFDTSLSIVRNGADWGTCG